MGTNGASVMVKILAKMRIEDVTVAVFDRELSKSTDTHKLVLIYFQLSFF